MDPPADRTCSPRPVPFPSPAQLGPDRGVAPLSPILASDTSIRCRKDHNPGGLALPLAGAARPVSRYGPADPRLPVPWLSARSSSGRRGPRRTPCECGRVEVRAGHARVSVVWVQEPRRRSIMCFMRRPPGGDDRRQGNRPQERRKQQRESEPGQEAMAQSLYVADARRRGETREAHIDAGLWGRGAGTR
jgi:hypothetical protein